MHGLIQKITLHFIICACAFLHDILRILEYNNITNNILRIKEYIPHNFIILLMANKTTVILSDENLKKIQNRKSALQAKSTKNITFTEAINDLLSSS